MQKATYKLLNHIEDTVIYNDVLPYMKAKYQDRFATLVIPDVVAVDLNRRQGCLKLYEGATFNETWGHEDGGSRIDLDTANLMINMVSDLSIIGTPIVEDIFLRGGISLDTIAFDLSRWKESLNSGDRQQRLARRFDPSEIEQLQQIHIAGERLFSNGDFYIRNVVRQEQKAVLVDWNYFNGFRCCYIDYRVNILAFAYIHMWGNTQWQSRLRSLALERFGISEIEFANAVVIKAVEQYLFLTNNTDICDMFCNAMVRTVKETLAIFRERPEPGCEA